MPENIHYQNGLKNIGLEKLESALRDFTSSINQNPLHIDSFYQRGLIYFKLKNYKESLADFDQALILNPQNPFRYSSRAYVYAFIGDYQSAVDDYQKAIQLDPEDAISMNNLGLVLEKIGYRQKAEDYFAQADEIADKGKTFEKPDLDEILKRHNTFEQNQATFQSLNATNRHQTKLTYMGIIKSIFTNKETFREFLNFLKIKRK